MLSDKSEIVQLKNSCKFCGCQQLEIITLGRSHSKFFKYRAKCPKCGVSVNGNNKQELIQNVEEYNAK